MTRLLGRGAVAALTGLVAAGLALAGDVGAQGVRGWTGSHVQWVELRPLVRDTLDGMLDFRPGSVEGSLAVTQDVSLTAWGFGVQGLSLTTYARARSRLGSDRVWPRSDDAFDLLTGYLQWVRDGGRLRLGRQEIRSGLGFSAFDGGSVAWSLGAVRLEGYGGRSLARGLREPARDILRGLEDFVPDESVWLLGGSVGARWARTSVRARYQRELLADRSGLAAERASLDATTTLPWGRLDGSLDWDLGLERAGKGHLELTVPLAGARWIVEASARRYVPYFSLSTIWGFFDPVPYHEGVLRVSWSPASVAGAWVAGGYRSYGDTETDPFLSPLTDDGWRGELGGRWDPAGPWSTQATYRVEWGGGGFLSSLDGELRWSPSARWELAGTFTSFQQIEEFRLGDGRATGGGLQGRADLSETLRLSGGWMLLRQSREGSRPARPWNQNRAWLSLGVTLGGDPGLVGRP